MLSYEGIFTYDCLKFDEGNEILELSLDFFQFYSG